jgi:hypothetical protein
MTSAAAIEQALTEHRGVSVSAKWPGSPDPGNPRNIRRVCACGEVIGQLPYPTEGTFRLGGEPFDEPHRTHVAAAIAAALETR